MAKGVLSPYRTSTTSNLSNLRSVPGVLPELVPGGSEMAAILGRLIISLLGVILHEPRFAGA